jgi:serine/threonine-protein kinase
VKALFQAALDREPHERAAFLREACGTDAALHDDVESLVRAHLDAGSFAQGPAVQALGRSAADALAVAGRVLVAGDRVGPYKILSVLGAGGMGEVYRAHDATLRRDVAIKILPPVFAANPERLARFDREARVLASLNHPHVASIYGLEEAAGGRALVLELVEGETLAERIARGAVPATEALTIARQIADALEAAHEKAIIHRDLKPANIAVTPDGTVKVLDFGVAKLQGSDGSGLDVTQSPALTVGGTREGLVPGTAAYMSPEQARGQAVDKRTDIWAFGCVLYEMLTGRSPFAGATVPDTMAAILEREPDWRLLPEPVTPNIRRLLQRCVEKDPKRRLHDIADARIEIEDATSEPSKPGHTGAKPATPHASPRTLLAWSLTSLVVAFVVATAALWRLKPEPAATVARFTIAPAADEILPNFPSVAISGDGARVAYVATRGEQSWLFLRGIAEVESTLVSGSDGAAAPFFSPNGQWVAFFAGGKLKKVSVIGGTPAVVCDAPSQRGGAWAPDDTIVFAPLGRGGLVRVPAAGGTPTELTHLSEHEGSHRYPQVLPDGKAVLFAAGPAGTATYWNEAHIVVQSLTSGERRVLVPRGTYPRYIGTGHVVYVEASALFALPFDARRLESLGTPLPLSERVVQSPAGSAALDVSRTGSLVYARSAGPSADSLVWVDRHGNVDPTGLSVATQSQPRVSPDGKRVAYMVAQPDTDIWVYDVARRTTTRLTSGGGNLWPIWTPEGQRITFSSVRTGAAASFWKPADDANGREEQLTTDGFAQSWSSDGKTLAFINIGPATGSDIWLLSLVDRKPRPFLQTSFTENMPAFSGDGRWIAYVSNDSGHSEVFVRAYPGPSPRWQVSRGGGDEPVWNHNSRELFFRHGDDMMAVEVSPQTSFTAGTPYRLFTGQFTPGLDRANYDAMPDGQHFVIVKPTGVVLPPRVNITLNWIEELKQRVPTR